ncbi:hypothetical protein LCGC14_2064530 [marine sediment metagenome]|uniref:Methyltransferase domain-containing protein n=1 Tax=marine sediment metagenome TaxID=412755 RepID=A0A0F9EKC2_9ZZZZ
MDYEKETRIAFRDTLKAKTYKEQYTKGLKWARFTMWRERMCVENALKRCNLKIEDNILDIPCGTGLMFFVFSKFPFKVFAADISLEMMSHAIEESEGLIVAGFALVDITNTPFARETFTCVVTNGLMHRLPDEIKKKALNEVSLISKRFLIVSYCVDSPMQRFKKRVIKMFRPAHIPAPAPASLQEIIREFNSTELHVKKMYRIVNFLSAQVLFLLEKKVYES